jgi:tRNA pseudouridine55 synthase
VSSTRSRGRNVFGLLLLDKPAGMSSNQALQRVKRFYAAARAGHSGSLDPLATGMLPIFFGSATHLCAYLLDSAKEYRATATLGVATTTGDAEGEVTVDRSSELPAAPEAVARVLEQFLGETEQIPPMFSALKRGGVPLYRLARRGVEVDRAPRRVFIEALILEDYRWPEVTFRVRCSKGTYVRTLAEDIARALGTVGHIAALRRLAVQPFFSHTMVALETVAEAASRGAAALDALLLAPDAALPGMPAVEVPEAAAVRLAHGQAVPTEPEWPSGIVRVYGPHRSFLALGRVTADGWLAPQRVFRR